MSAKKDLHPEQVRKRSEALSILDPKSIQTMSRRELLRLQKNLGYGNEWRVWEVPKSWLPKNAQRTSDRTVRMDGCDSPSDSAWCELLRFALARSLVPGQKGGIPKPKTVLTELKAATRIAPQLIAARKDQESFWSAITIDEMYAAARQGGLILASSVCHLYRFGLLADQPRGSVRDDGPAERNRKGEQVARHQVDNAKAYQPLTDEFTGQCGQRELWMIKTLGPALLNAAEAAIEAEIPPPAPNTRTPGCRTPRQQKEVARVLQNQIISNWKWVDFSGEPINNLRFPLNLRRRISTGMGSMNGLPTHEDFSWPPRGLTDLLPLLGLLQSSHLWIVLLASGPRASTVASYTEKCLLPASGGGFRLTGSLLKTSDEFGGRKRDWPAPPIVVQAIRQQMRLARIFKRRANWTHPESLGDHLWVQTRNNAEDLGGPVSDFSGLLDILVDRFGLRHLLGDENPRLHVHRFRKTLARIVALSLTNAQMILMDCFGHDDPEMTLHRYILSDPAILADVQQVQRELVVLMAKDAIEHAETLGGAMGIRVRAARSEFQRLHRKSELDPKDILELAEMLTLGGRDWVIVMPGVICTLPIGFTGPCAARQGGRNPANCQSGCSHQLLLDYHKTECDEMVSYIVDQLQAATDQESVTVPMWEGQLRNWLYRWRQVYDKWASHPLVKLHGDPKMQREEIPS